MDTGGKGYFSFLSTQSIKSALAPGKPMSFQPVNR